jgi:hypothetical protein
MPTFPKQSTVVGGADLCLPDTCAYGQAKNLRIHSINITRMVPVEFSGALQGQRIKATDEGGAFKTAAVRHCQQVPSSSLYLAGRRGLGRSAVSFAELPTASRFICILTPLSRPSCKGEMHI